MMPRLLDWVPGVVASLMRETPCHSKGGDREVVARSLRGSSACDFQRSCSRRSLTGQTFRVFPGRLVSWIGVSPLKIRPPWLDALRSSSSIRTSERTSSLLLFLLAASERLLTAGAVGVRDRADDAVVSREGPAACVQAQALWSPRCPAWSSVNVEMTARGGGTAAVLEGRTRGRCRA